MTEINYYKNAPNHDWARGAIQCTEKQNSFGLYVERVGDSRRLLAFEVIERLPDLGVAQVLPELAVFCSDQAVG